MILIPVEEAEQAVTDIEEIVAGNRFGNVENVTIPTIYNELKKLDNYDVRKEVVEAVVSPEQGGVVKMSFFNN